MKGIYFFESGGLPRFFVIESTQQPCIRIQRLQGRILSHPECAFLQAWHVFPLKQRSGELFTGKLSAAMAGGDGVVVIVGVGVLVEDMRKENVKQNGFVQNV